MVFTVNDKELITLAAGAAREKKAEGLVALDLKGLSSVADLFLICSAANEKQVEAIAKNIEVRLKEAGVRLLRLEGLPEAHWAVLDYGNVLIHVFLQEARDFYSLETLWGDAPRLDLPPRH